MRRGPRWFAGSADALYQNLNLIADEGPDVVFVFGADHIHRLDPRQMLNAHVESGAGVTVAAIRLPKEEAHQFGTIEKDPSSDKILGFHEKRADAPTIPDLPDMILASMGNYIFEVDTFRDIMAADAEDERSNHDLGGDIIPKLVAQGAANVYDYNDNIVPGDTGSDNHYWRDVGTIDSYFDSHMDLVAPLPAFSLYNHQWPIFTRGLTEPPAKIANGPDGPSEISNCILANGVIVSGGIVHESVLSRDVIVDNRAEVYQSVLMGNVTVGKGARLNRCIIDKNVLVPPGFEIGFDPAADAERFYISDNGVVTVPKNYRIDPR